MPTAEQSGLRMKAKSHTVITFMRNAIVIHIHGAREDSWISVRAHAEGTSASSQVPNCWSLRGAWKGVGGGGKHRAVAPQPWCWFLVGRFASTASRTGTQARHHSLSFDPPKQRSLCAVLLTIQQTEATRQIPSCYYCTVAALDIEPRK
jgi:hypothetical protein